MLENEKEFKVLVFGHEYVDYSKIIEGIYTTNIPRLFSKETTIESLVDNFNELRNMYGELVEISVFDRLKQCRLVTVNLEPKP